VLIPKIEYNGQNPMNDVSTKTSATTPKIIAIVPEITFKK
jgi:hypothetical protein